MKENDRSDFIDVYVIKTLNENTCKRCQNYERCWKENYHKMYELTFNAIENNYLSLEEKIYHILLKFHIHLLN